MSVRLAQIYAGNPLSLTEEELSRIANLSEIVERNSDAFVHVRVRGRSGKGWSKPSVVDVVLPARRVGGEKVIATFDSEVKANFFIASLKYLWLLPVAVRELRQRPELIAKNQLAMRADPETDQ